tara:strand:+ start:4843 stop:5022 length:180 start_codon:yes stop_codon:yes gene_type:complete
MTRTEIDDKIIILREKLVDMNIELNRIAYEKRSAMSSIRYYEDMLLNQLEIDFDDCDNK